MRKQKVEEPAGTETAAERERRNTLRALWASCVLVVSAGCVYYGDKPLKPPVKRPPEPAAAAAKKTVQAHPWGKPVKGLVSGIWTDKRAFAPGEPIVVHYQIKNVSPRRQIVWHSGFWTNNKITVLDAAGNDVTATTAGEERRGAFSPGAARAKNVKWLLPPGHLDEAQPSVDIGKFFKLAAPGKYRVQYLYSEFREGWFGELKSNVLAIEILPAPSEGAP